MQVYMKPQYGTISYKGHVVTLPHNLHKIADVLPNTPVDLPVLVFQASANNDRNLNFKVRHQNIEALLWLKRNNRLYQDITIDMERVDNLPEDDFLSIPSITLNEPINTAEEYDCGPNEDQENNASIETSSFLPSTTNKQPTEQARLQDSLKSCGTIDIEQDPLSEFKTSCIASLAFRTLFPDTDGDPTNHSTIRSIGRNDLETFDAKLTH